MHPEVNATDISQEAKRRTDGVAEIGRRAIGEFKRALASVGVDVARLFSHFGVNRAEGGPFVPPTRADQPAGGIVADGSPAFAAWRRRYPCRHRSSITKSEAGPVRAVTHLTGGLRSIPG